MSNDPFFEAWVREHLKDAETRTPEHLWDSVRKRHTYGILMERTKYACLVALLLTVTGGIGYWGFHRDLIKVAAAARAGSPASASHIGNAAFASHISDATSTAQNNSGPSIVQALTHKPASSVSPAGSASARQLLPDAGPRPTSAVAASSSADIAFSPASANLSIRLASRAALASGPAALRVATSLTPPLVLRHREPVLIEGYGGPDHAARYLRASNQTYIPYVSRSKHTITPYPSFSAGFRIDIPLMGKWSLRTGINFSQINEVFNYQNDDDKRVITDLTNRQVTTTSGTTVTLVDTSRISINGKLVKRSLNAYRMVDVPLLVSYSLPRMGRLQLSGSTGALVNLSSWYTGDVLDTADAPIALTTKTNQGVASWRKYIGAAWYGSMILRTQVAPRLQATVEPYLRYDFSPVNQDVSVFRQRYVTTGLMAGLAYRLGR